MSADSRVASHDDWLDDFGAVVKTDEELRAWYDSLHGPDVAEVRQLVSEAQCMRWAARCLLERLSRLGGWPPRDGETDEATRLAVWFVEVRDPDRSDGRKTSDR